MHSLALLRNIRRGYKFMRVYFARTRKTKKKSFYNVEANFVKLFFFFIRVLAK
jgi:hypothetical protein